MPHSTDRAGVRRLLAEEGGQLVEVLPADDFAEEHIVGAVNIPQKMLTAQATAHLAKDAPLIVYCYDLD